MRLNDTIIRNTPPGSKPIKLLDGDGLYMLVQPNGSRWWRMRYYVDGVEKTLSVGVYPEVSLKRARERRHEIRSQVANGSNPSDDRKAQRCGREQTFELVAREWWEKRKHLWKDEYAHVILTRFSQDVFPYIGKRPVAKLEAPDFLECLERMQKRGVLQTAHKVKTKCSEVMRYAVATRRAPRDPLVDLKGALPPVRAQHYASITFPSEVGALLRAIEGYQGKSRVVQAALKLLPLVFVRSSELRYARWDEFDLDGAEWRIPAERMKRKIQHVVPLSRQAVAALNELYPYSGPQGFVFPSIRSFSRPISENTVNAALRRMGYAKNEMTGHGFRSMASTLLNEQGWHPDAIERQLSHCEENDVRAAYNYAEYLPQRREMMQAWGDYLDSLRAGRVSRSMVESAGERVPLGHLHEVEARG